MALELTNLEVLMLTHVHARVCSDDVLLCTAYGGNYGADAGYHDGMCLVLNIAL